MYETRQPITHDNIAAEIARTRDAVRIERPQPARRRPVRGSAIKAAMAAAIRDIGEGCTDRDLLPRFTRAEITTYGDAAAELAKAEACFA